MSRVTELASVEEWEAAKAATKGFGGKGMVRHEALRLALLRSLQPQLTATAYCS